MLTATSATSQVTPVAPVTATVLHSNRPSGGLPSFSYTLFSCGNVGKDVSWIRYDVLPPRPRAVMLHWADSMLGRLSRDCLHCTESQSLESAGKEKDWPMKLSLK